MFARTRSYTANTQIRGLHSRISGGKMITSKLRCKEANAIWLEAKRRQQLILSSRIGNERYIKHHLKIYTRLAMSMCWRWICMMAMWPRTQGCAKYIQDQQCGVISQRRPECRTVQSRTVVGLWRGSVDAAG